MTSEPEISVEQCKDIQEELLSQHPVTTGAVTKDTGVNVGSDDKVRGVSQVDKDDLCDEDDEVYGVTTIVSLDQVGVMGVVTRVTGWVWLCVTRVTCSL